MDKIVGWLKTNDLRILLWANQKPDEGRIYQWLGKWFSSVTHMGGASFTLTTALLIALFAPIQWNMTGWQCLTAVCISHLPVAIGKRAFKRLRPYQEVSHVNTTRKPLQDHSFPSGHTTAIFAWLVPIVLTSGVWLSVLMPAALIIGLSVAWSRMYLGLHYPSDVIAGAFLGTITAIAVNYYWLPSSVV